ncbi:MAG: asparaginyl-tRNA synthetase [Planctomycetota bacterium]|jgi:asparaginyl-tRNA synthetase
MSEIITNKKIKEININPELGAEYMVHGWVQSFRSNRFIHLNDGSGSKGLQVVVQDGVFDEELLSRIHFHSCLEVRGTLLDSPGEGQPIELKATEVIIIGESDPEKYPLQPKKQTMEFLREQAHLRLRTKTFGAIFRIRHSLAYAVHTFFHTKGFYWLHTPIITGSDAEGAGEMFHVTAFDLENPAKTDQGTIDYSKDFFGKQTNLTVSGQLQAEAGALALGQVYTFGPTFRAENSNTSRHLAEFWMIEPEVAFMDLDGDMSLAEEFVQYVIKHILEHNRSDLELLDARIVESEKNMKTELRRPMGLIETLRFVTDNPFKRISYTEAVELLLNSKPYKKGKFKYPIEWGVDLQSEHERWLVEKKFEQPVIVYDYPKDVKAFYMRQNDDGKTVAAMDVLFPGIGEVIGGSQREERLDKLEQRIDEMNIDMHELQWYLDLRRFGGCPHSGFGLGFERLVQFTTGMANIRDVVAFPRTPGNAEI